MTNDPLQSARKTGMALVATVFLITAIADTLAVVFTFAAGSRALMARKQIFLEQAMYVAEAGAETAMTYVAAGGTTPSTLTGTVGSGQYVAMVTSSNATRWAPKVYFVRSVGRVKDMSRTVTIDSIRRQTFAKYALWSHDNRKIYFASGDRFDGPVHANNLLYFNGDPEFLARVTSGASTYGGSTNACTFHAGFIRPVATQTMATVDFPTLKSQASLVVTGATTIVFSGTNALITNTARGWSSKKVDISEDALIYTATSGAQSGTVSVRGTLNGRVTVVADTDINITGNLTYAADPAVGVSDDVLGLISGEDIVVKTTFPNNGKIHAHMLATGRSTAASADGSFGVENYSSRSPSGLLTVYGGVVQYYRGAVGTFSGRTLMSGFDKNYVYDPRLSANPPPAYPAAGDEFTWGTWRENP